MKRHLSKLLNFLSHIAKVFKEHSTRHGPNLQDAIALSYAGTVGSTIGLDGVHKEWMVAGYRQAESVRLSLHHNASLNHSRPGGR